MGSDTFDAGSREVGGESRAATAYAAKEAEVYDEKRLTTPGAMAIHRAELRLLFSAIANSNPTGPMLEVGCGTGRMLMEVHDRGHRVSGADASGAMLEQLKAKLPADEQIDLIICDAASIPRESSQYDLVYSIRLLNQTESPEYALSVVREMLRLAKDRGLVLVEFVNEYRPRWGAARTATTRLKPADVVDCGRKAGGTLAGVDGAFFLSMQAYHACPVFLLPVLRVGDRILSRMFPRLCSRCYVSFRKSGAPTKV